VGLIASALFWKPRNIVGMGIGGGQIWPPFGLQGFCTIWFSYAYKWFAFYAAISRLVGGMLNSSVPIKNV
jgi:hypothetical protein